MNTNKELKKKIEKLIFKKLGDATRKLIKDSQAFLLHSGRKEADFKTKKGDWITLELEKTSNFYSVFKKEIKKEAEWKKIYLLKDINTKLEKSEENKNKILELLANRVDAICYITDCIVVDNLAYDLEYREDLKKYVLTYLEYDFQEVEDFKNHLLGDLND